MEWFFYTLAFLIAVAITGTAVFSLYWSSRNGQLRDFERGATSIFDDEEPVGRMTDRFPQAGRRKPGTGKPETGSGEAKPESLG